MEQNTDGYDMCVYVYSYGSFIPKNMSARLLSYQNG